MLQWGRDSSAAEMPLGTATFYLGVAASMGPRLFSRGNGRIAGVQGPLMDGFNGAATLQPRKCSGERRRSIDELAASMGPRLFSRGNGVGDVPRPRPLAASMGPRLFSRGNGAAWQPACRMWVFASMGPRLFSRGNTSAARLAPHQPLQASMGPRLFSRGNNTADTGCTPAEVSFNGAATLQPRKYAGARSGGVRGAMLQWGRDSSAAEILPYLYDLAR